MNNLPITIQLGETFANWAVRIGLEAILTIDSGCSWRNKGARIDYHKACEYCNDEFRLTLYIEHLKAKYGIEEPNKINP